MMARKRYYKPSVEDSPFYQDAIRSTPKNWGVWDTLCHNWKKASLSRVEAEATTKRLNEQTPNDPPYYEARPYSPPEEK